MKHDYVTIEGNEAAASVAFRINEVIAIYPITPATPMGEYADFWRSQGIKNIWGATPTVVEMQSEGGAAGAIHGALQCGSLSTTFTASQGLLLMLPNMYKIAGELTSAVFHVAARSLAAQGLSIFGDHSDVMATRGTGWGMLFANSVQEVMDFALIAQASTLEARIPFLHVFDGFRTSHEINKIKKLSDADIRFMIDDALVHAHRDRALNPDNPFIRGTSQNPDVFFQARETVNPYYLAVPEIVQAAMDKFAERVGRQYRLFEYIGAEDAERIIVLMGSGGETVEETIQYLAARGEKVGMVKVRLFRPFATERFLNVLPATAKVVAALDRTKEPGSAGEPLYQDVVTAVNEGMASGKLAGNARPFVIGGRYGLSSKEFTPAMVRGLLIEMEKDRPKNHFTLGIIDDLTHSSIDFDPQFEIEPDEVLRAVFWGLGSDGTVSANKNSIKIIGEETSNYAQGYFVYDSKKSGARTISHLRFGPRPIKSPYLVTRANFVAVHQFDFLKRYKVLDSAGEGATFLLNAPFGPDQIWDELPHEIQKQIIEKKLHFYTIDAYKVAKELSLGVRINTIMQTCFFAISNVLPRDESIQHIKQAIQKTYGKRGEVVVKRNFAAVDAALGHLHPVAVPEGAREGLAPTPTVPEYAPQFVRDVTAKMMAGEGDTLPVSALPVDGTYPSGTTRWEKRNIALEVPVWEPDLCIQCGKCVLVCPHAVIRGKVFDAENLVDPPEHFKYTDARWRELPDKKYTLQVAVEDCTGCNLCVEICPAKDKSAVGRKAINMAPQAPLREQEVKNWDFFLNLPEQTLEGELHSKNVKNVQLLQPLFEFSGACAGCGETPYLKLLSQLFGERAVIANATGCSSIYGGNLPTTPWTTNAHGRGPAWSNSLFEDNAEFGLGMRLSMDQQAQYARQLVERLSSVIGDDLADALLQSDQSDEAAIGAQRERVAQLKTKLKGTDKPLERDLLNCADKLVKKSVWIVGGDGWAYDIGFGGLDHVLASGQNINILVLDTEVYSNTGGQASKSTPLGAVAKFAASGKSAPKKDLGMMAVNYENIYVANVAMGASDGQTLKAFKEAESYNGPSLIIAYSHCIAHGINIAKGAEQQKLAVQSGYWPLYRFDPRLKAEGKNPLQLDSKAPKIAFKEYAYNENRYRILTQSDPTLAKKFLDEAQAAILKRWQHYEALAQSEKEQT